MALAALVTWAAFADLLAVAVIGDLLVLRWTKDRRAGLEGSGASPVVGRHWKLALLAAVHPDPKRLVGAPVTLGG